MMPPEIAKFYNDLIHKYGDSFQGIGWEGEVQEIKRFQTMFDVFKNEINPSKCDWDLFLFAA
jgi:hypothetical protein